jgi:hypothetical protein
MNLNAHTRRPAKLPVSKARLERLKSELQFRQWIAKKQFFECLSVEQLTFFAQHGYVEATVTRPEHSELDGLSRKALLKLWREDERRDAIKFEGRSDDEMRFYIQNGRFPEEADNPTHIAIDQRLHCRGK